MAALENDTGKAEYFLQRGMPVPPALIKTSDNALLAAENDSSRPILDPTIGTNEPDQDNDGIPDSFDVDADGDGLEDDDIGPQTDILPDDDALLDDEVLEEDLLDDDMDDEDLEAGFDALDDDSLDEELDEEEFDGDNDLSADADEPDEADPDVAGADQADNAPGDDFAGELEDTAGVTSQFAGIDAKDPSFGKYMNKLSPAESAELATREDALKLATQRGDSPRQIADDTLNLASFKATIIEREADKTGDSAALQSVQDAQIGLAQRGDTLRRFDDSVQGQSPAQQALAFNQLLSNTTVSAPAAMNAGSENPGLTGAFGQVAPLPQPVQVAPLPELATALPVTTFAPPKPVTASGPAGMG